jgi:hypothetical protein
MNPELDILREAEAAADRLKDQETTFRARHSQLTAERSRVFNGLRSRREVVENTARLVDEQMGSWRALHGPAVLRALSGSEEEQWSSSGPNRVRTVPPRLPDIMQPTGHVGLTLADICGLFPDVVKSSLTSMVKAMPNEAFGLSTSERAARLTAIDREISDVEAAHTKLVEAMTARGLTGFSLLRTVVERREEERLERERLKR